MRARLARLGSRHLAHPELEPLLRAVRATHPKADVSIIERAYETAEKWHAGQVRKNGDPYITHPLAVTTILAEIGMPPTTLAAAMLHDTVEDTGYSLEALRADYGDEIAMLVDGVTKLDKVTYGEAAQAETVRKMVIAMSRDIRVLVIKLADRLHNARTWRYVSPASAAKKARETLEIYAPLAHRLGMNTIKWELEDLSFATLYPKVYDEIVRMVAERAPAREEYLGQVKRQVEEDLKGARITATVTGRPKHYYSVYQKMIVRGRDFEEIYDLVAVRVLVDTVRDCYAALGTMHARWKPMPGRFKDYIAMPKFNMYQSLHTTVVGPGGKPVEIQIRTHAMHRRAEYGVAAHWKYKEDTATVTPGGEVTDGDPNDMAWLRQLVDWQRETADPGEFLDSLRFEINAQEVFAFTPKGAVIALPLGSTPVDFAYAVHTEVGHHCIGGRVNGRLVPLESQLENGDIVEILTSKVDGDGPSRDWLTFVKSPRARNKIRQWFTKERREEAIENGREEIARTIRKQNLPLQRLMTAETLSAIANELRYADIEALYAAVGEKNVSAQSVVERIIAASGGEAGAEEDLAEVTMPGRPRRRRPAVTGVVVAGESGVETKLAKCCTPVPGDEIMGFTTRGGYVSVHRTNCTNADGLRAHPERLVEVSWDPSASSMFLVQFQVEALDRSRLLSDITRVLSDHHVNILSAAVKTSRDRLAVSNFTFEMGDPSHLEHVIKAVRRIDGVFDVYRVSGVKHPNTQ
ncbi:RelA/SpoT family protein [Mobilicoccus pelagius]|uniref:GTP pyrophosphokinase/guanosine-3',5'-bis (Diphosphate) 3'-pyrophosphohydrolase n=1 Tax=Mobilicoccus pelagius NBRC 104925 TaxID=1089455 RepID=H5UPF3_9MICO|nr:RelA/SpoT family protein [Mobilicoccus pelagius]GAB47611.1 GTP pyrophosphokinase/guanosine-3',5'-bis (diphosphate) 3'-pyrophosphohydrolase [Mobilicoccus pelagius NBRC 104925]